MASVFSAYAFDQLDFNLNRVYSNAWDYGLLDNYGLSYNGITYNDAYVVDWYYSGTYFGSVFAGPNIYESGSSISGTVTGYLESYLNGEEYIETWGIENISINASVLVNAAQTASTVDDFVAMGDMLSGADTFYLSNFDDYAFALSGNDRLYGYAGNDELDGGSGNDRLYGGAGNDKSYGEAGNDSLYMDAGNDTLDGGTGTDWLYVTGSTNSVVNLAKTTGQDTGYGTDIIKNIENASGGSGVDKFYGTTGNNTLKGNNGNDILDGKNGNDVLYGGNNNDKLYGGSGNDTLKGDAGRDVLQGDAGKDFLYGGADADTFVFRKTSDSSASASSADVIYDFKHGVDKIDLHYIDASTKLSGNNTFTFDGTTKFGTSSQGDIYYKQFNYAGTSNDYTMVYIDTDNDTGTEMSIKLMGLHALTASDFIL